MSLHSDPQFKTGVSHLYIHRKLQSVGQALILLGEQGMVKGFFNNVGNADKLNAMAEDIRDAMIDYQVCALNDPFLPCLKLLPDIDGTRHIRHEPPTRREFRLIPFCP